MDRQRGSLAPWGIRSGGRRGHQGGDRGRAPGVGGHAVRAAGRDMGRADTVCGMAGTGGRRPYVDGVPLLAPEDGWANSSRRAAASTGWPTGAPAGTPPPPRPAALAGFLRDHAHHPWKPPVGGIAAALGHDVVHGLDITVALGIDRRVPEDRIRILLDTVTPEPPGSSGATSAASNSAPTTSTGPSAPARRCPAPHRTSCCWPTAENFPRATSGASRAAASRHDRHSWRGRRATGPLPPGVRRARTGRKADQGAAGVGRPRMRSAAFRDALLLPAVGSAPSGRARRGSRAAADGWSNRPRE